MQEHSWHSSGSRRQEHHPPGCAPRHSGVPSAGAGRAGAAAAPAPLSPAALQPEPASPPPHAATPCPCHIPACHQRAELRGSCCHRLPASLGRAQRREQRHPRLYRCSCGYGTLGGQPAVPAGAAKASSLPPQLLSHSVPPASSTFLPKSVTSRGAQLLRSPLRGWKRPLRGWNITLEATVGSLTLRLGFEGAVPELDSTAGQGQGRERSLLAHKRSYKTTCRQSSQQASEVCGQEPGSYRGI